MMKDYTQKMNELIEKTIEKLDGNKLLISEEFEQHKEMLEPFLNSLEELKQELEELKLSHRFVKTNEEHEQLESEIKNKKMQIAFRQDSIEYFYNPIIERLKNELK